MKAIKLLFIALFLLLSGFVLSVPRAHADWNVDDQHQLIPLYVYPSWWVTGNDWTRACEGSNSSHIGSTMIANPSNGPGSARNTDYAQAIEICHDNGQNVIGYVDTSYGAVPLATVKANIDKWYSYYDGDNTGVYDLGITGIDTHIDGIFIDQMSNFPNDTANTTDNITVANYYKQIFNYIKSVAPGDYNDVIGNAGSAASTDWQLDDLGQNPTQVADEVVVFEGPITGTYGLNNFSRPAWVDDYPASDIGMLVYNTASTDISSVCTTLKNNNAGLVDVTDATITSTSTPWNSFQGSTYWSSFRSHCD
jgi:hypothetical protein